MHDFGVRDVGRQRKGPDSDEPVISFSCNSERRGEPQRLRRFHQDVSGYEADELLDSIPLKSQREAYADEVARGLLFDLGDNWNVVHASVSGDQDDSDHIE
jgi:hypothetical protein